MAALKPLRGEIWMFDLNPKKGREQKGVRPCLVVSTDALNRSDFGTVVICPVTTTEIKKTHRKKTARRLSNMISILPRLAMATCQKSTRVLPFSGK